VSVSSPYVSNSSSSHIVAVWRETSHFIRREGLVRESLGEGGEGKAE